MQKYIVSVNQDGKIKLPEQIRSALHGCTKININRIKGYFELTLPNGEPIKTDRDISTVAK